jgi:hypothetical protein
MRLLHVQGQCGTLGELVGSPETDDPVWAVPRDDLELA